MDISKFLKSVGGAVLKNVPMGGMIYDIADTILDEVLPPDITGDEIVKKLQKLPPEQYSKIMSKQIDADVAKVQSWTDLRKTMEVSSPASKSRSIVTAACGVGIMIMTLMFTYMFIQRWMTTLEWPPIETLLIIYGLPSIILLSSYGVKSDKFLDLILSAAIKRIK